MHRNLSARSRRIGLALLLSCLLVSAASLIAQEPAGEVDVVPSAETVYSLFVKGGVLMYPILLCSLIILTLAIERAQKYYQEVATTFEKREEGKLARERLEKLEID